MDFTIICTVCGAATQKTDDDEYGVTVDVGWDACDCCESYVEETMLSYPVSVVYLSESCGVYWAMFPRVLREA